MKTHKTLVVEQLQKILFFARAAAGNDGNIPPGRDVYKRQAVAAEPKGGQPLRTGGTGHLLQGVLAVTQSRVCLLYTSATATSAWCFPQTCSG